MTSAPSIYEFLKLLTPFDPVDLKKIRVGGTHDGGYVMLDDIQNGTALSFGVGDEITWDTHMAHLGNEVFLFDHTVEAPAALPKNCHFYQKGLTTSNKQIYNLYSLGSVNISQRSQIKVETK